MSKPIKILLADDEADILEFLKYNLEKEGYEVLLAETGKQALEIAKKENPDMVILDIMMPDIDGIETCRQLRNIPSFKNTLIVFLTARNEDYSQIAGFDGGADDYITKPIKVRVLISRIKGLLRRLHNPDERTKAGDIEIDKEQYLVFQKGKELRLPKKEFELIELLISKPGKVFTRDEILNKLWGSDIIVGDRTIDVHIRKLREKLGDHYIRTLKGIGYKFEIE